MIEKSEKNLEIGRTRSGLRYGYTTGSCAAAAAKAAAEMLLSGKMLRQVSLMTPKGIRLCLDVEKTERSTDRVRCAVRKYSGDDPDVTDGMLIFVQAERFEGDLPSAEKVFLEGNLILCGGEGVGTVTEPGLEQQAGFPAINRVPRMMIFSAVREVCDKYGFTGKIKMTVCIPGGEETALKTFNARLGIRGGLSVLGTTGIVEPMSEKALVDTIYLEMKVLRKRGRQYCCAVPGNYGSFFLREKLGLDPEKAVKFSNYVGEMLDDACLLDMKGILLAGHAGKLVKIAAGVMNTHSKMADCRMEIFAAYAAAAGAGSDTVSEILKCINTDEAVRILREKDFLQRTMETVMERIDFYLRQRTGGKVSTGAVLFTSQGEMIGMTQGAGKLIRRIREEDKTGGERH